jgi:hypothetical protein
VNICGIDLSTHAVDVVLLDMDSDQAEWRRWDLGTGDLIERVRRIGGSQPWGSGIWGDVVAVGIERPAGKHGVPQVSMAFGAVLARVIPCRLLVKPWLPAEWRKACGLKGNASKDEVASFATGAEVAGEWTTIPASAPMGTTERALLWPQDACDAYAIAYATRSVLETVKEAA